VSQTSQEIQRGLEEFELDAGITYLDNEPLQGVRAKRSMSRNMCS